MKGSGESGGRDHKDIKRAGSGDSGPRHLPLPGPHPRPHDCRRVPATRCQVGGDRDLPVCEPQALDSLGVQVLIQRQIRYLLGKEAVWELPCSPLSLPVYFPTSSAFFFLRSFKSDHLLLPVVAKTQPDPNVCFDFNKDNVINFLL